MDNTILEEAKMGLWDEDNETPETEESDEWTDEDDCDECADELEDACND